MASLPVASQDACSDTESDHATVPPQRMYENPLFWMVTAVFALLVIGVTISYTLALTPPNANVVAAAPPVE